MRVRVLLLVLGGCGGGKGYVNVAADMSSVLEEVRGHSIIHVGFGTKELCYVYRREKKKVLVGLFGMEQESDGRRDERRRKNKKKEKEKRKEKV